MALGGVNLVSQKSQSSIRTHGTQFFFKLLELTTLYPYNQYYLSMFTKLPNGIVAKIETIGQFTTLHCVCCIEYTWLFVNAQFYAVLCISHSKCIFLAFKQFDSTKPTILLKNIWKHIQIFFHSHNLIAWNHYNF